MWKITKISDNKISCDNDDLEADMIPEVLSKLKKGFNVRYDNKGGRGLNLTALNFNIDGQKIIIGWDCWSGVFIMPDNVSGNSVIEKISEYLSKNWR